MSDNAKGGDIEDIIKSSSIGILLFFFIIVVAAFFAIFFLLFCYTKRVSHSQFAYNSIFMFISGYSIIFFTLFYFIMSILCSAASKFADDNDVNNSTLDDYSSGL